MAQEQKGGSHGVQGGYSTPIPASSRSLNPSQCVVDTAPLSCQGPAGQDWPQEARATFLSGWGPGLAGTSWWSLGAEAGGEMFIWRGKWGDDPG